MQRKNTASTAALTLWALALFAAPAAAQLPAQIITQTNVERQRQGLRPLQYHPTLTATAVGHAEAMARSGSMSHVLGGSSLSTRMARSGYSYTTAGENIAYGQVTAHEVVADWMTSPSHRSNILGPSYTHIGVGVASGGNGRLYYCQVFGAPR